MKLVKVWAPWCGPCKQLTPELDKALEGQDIEFESVNVDEDAQRAAELEVMSVPTVLILKDNVEVDRFNGFRPAGAILEFIEENK